MKKYIVICSFLLLILSVSITANTDVAKADQNEVQFINADQNGLIDMQVNGEILEMIAIRDGTVKNSINTGQSQALNALNVNANTDNNNGLVITAVNIKSNAVVNKQCRVNGISIISEDFGTVNRFTNYTNLNSSLSGNNNADCEMQRGIGFESINQFEIANNQTSLVYSQVVNNNVACVNANTTTRSGTEITLI